MATRKINVIGSREVRSGTSANGAPWTLYEITAVDPDGSPIDLTLKSFDNLSGEVEVEVEKQEHEKYGTSYMLRKAGSRGGGGNPGARLGPKVDELRERLNLLEQQVSHMNDRLLGLEQTVGRLSAGGTAPTAPAAPTFGGDDVPF